MLNKTIEYVQGDHNSEVFSILTDSKTGSGFEKTASYAGEVQAFLASHKRQKDKIYALINALSAGEYYGSNKNGDYFPEEALKSYHHTFRDGGYVYRHHQNKDPKKSLGKVIFSHYNDVMKRVEIVVAMDKNNPGVLDLLDKLSKGELPKTSMGTRVPYDVCSCCGNRAKTRATYCDHLLYQMNQVLSNGKKVCAINTKPNFFDISLVTIPADPTSSFMKYWGIEKTASISDKNAAIKKQVVGTIENIEPDPKNLIKDTQPRFTREQLEKLSEYPLNEVLSTFLGLRIMPLKEDFQKLALYSLGKKDLAEDLEDKNIVFYSDVTTEPEIPNNLGPEYCNEKIAEELFSEIPKLSLTKWNIINRITEKVASMSEEARTGTYPNNNYERSFIQKALFSDEGQPLKSPVKNPMLPMLTLGAIYSGYASLFGSSASATGFTRFLSKNPWLGPLIAGGIAQGSTELQKLEYKNSPLYEQGRIKEAGMLNANYDFGRFLSNMLVATPLSYYASMKQDEKAMRGQRISNTEDFVRKHPLPVAFGTAMLAGAGMKGLGSAFKSFKKTAKYNPETINQIYKELIS